MRALLSFGVLVSALFTACSDDSPVGQTGDTGDTSELGADAAAEVLAPTVPTDLGELCDLGGCTFETCVSRTDCETLCLYDSRVTRFLAYCSMDCDDTTPCPAGYECILPKDSEFLEVDERVCAALPADCGNTIREQGEACDDGNTDAGDECAADCSEVTTPIEPEPELEKTSGRVTLTLDGVTTTYEGEVEGGFGRLIANGTLEWSTTAGNKMYRLDLVDFATRQSAAGSQLVRFWRLTDACQEGAGAQTTLTLFDAAAKRVAGSVSVSAAPGVCDGFSASVDFDFVWLERPDLTVPTSP